jgi:uncharacterized protein YkwD
MISIFRRLATMLLLAGCATVLTACGGGTGGDSPASAGNPAQAALPTPTSSVDTASFTTTTASGNTQTNPPPTTAAAQSCNLPNFSQEVLSRINAERLAGATCGGQTKPAALALAWNARLTEAARLHSQDMIDRNFFAHQNPSGQNAGARVQAQGYSWSAVGENIAAGQRSVKQVMDGWMASSGHCNNIMSANYTEVGVACVIKANDPNNYGYYWTMVLAKPR